MYNLLIVDDEYEIRHGISNYIPWDEFGFAVIGEAENGEEALDFIVSHHVDVVLCDIKMPIKSGLELAKELRAMNHPAKVIFLTGHKEFQLVQEALVYGAWNYIVKPTKYLELADVFQKLKLELDQANIHEEDELDVDDEDLIIKEIKKYTLDHFKTVQLKDLGLK